MNREVLLGVFVATIIFLSFVYGISISNPGLSSLQPLGFPVRIGQEFPFFKVVNLEAIVAGKEDNFALYVKDLNSGVVDVVGGEKGFYAASLFKVPVAISILKQVEAGDLAFENVDGLLRPLLKESDNDVQEALLGMADRSFIDSLMPDSDNLKVGEVAGIFEGIYGGKFLNEVNSKILLDYMIGTAFDDRIHAGLGVGTVFSHKIGNWPDTGTWHDCGILMNKTNPKILCLMSEGVSFEEFREVAKEFGSLF